MNEFYNLKEVAQLLRVSERTVLREIEQGKLESFKVGRAYRFKREAVQRYVDSQTVKPEEAKEEGKQEGKEPLPA